jgi:ubiquinone/menaquinone biosynthesis C-methylase UbiE
MATQEVSYLISSKDGLGHASRAVEVTKALKGAPQVELFLSDEAHDFIRQGLSPGGWNMHNLKYWGLNDKQLYEQNRENIEVMGRSGIVVTDWLGRAPRLVRQAEKYGQGQTPQLVGLYHGNFKDSPGDSRGVSQFKAKQRKLVEDMDIHLHTTPEPESQYGSSTPVIPVPLIVRGPNRSSGEVKRSLGMDPSEKYMFITVGGNAGASMEVTHDGKTNYNHLFSLIDKLDPTSLGIDRIIVNTGQKHFDFTSPYVHAQPFFNGGHDIIRASEIVVGKPGMGTLAECFRYGTPFLMVKWDLYGEEAEKVNMIKQVTDGRHPTIWGRNLDHLIERINLTLDRKDELSDRLTRVPTNGGEVVATLIQTLAENNGSITPALVNELLSKTPYGSVGKTAFMQKINYENREDYQNARRSSIVGLATENLDEGASVLEIGCNNGLISNAIAASGYNTMGVDISPKSVERATRIKHENATFRQMDACNLSIRDSCVDSIVMAEVLEHLPDPATAVGEAFRVLKDGGQLTVGVPLADKIYDPGHIWFYTPESLASVLHKFSDEVEFRNTAGIERHMHAIAFNNRNDTKSEHPTLYEVTLQDIRDMDETDLEDLASGLPSVPGSNSTSAIRQYLMDYRTMVESVDGRPIHRGTKVINPKEITTEEIENIGKYVVLYGLSLRENLPGREEFNKEELRTRLLEHFM